MKTTLVSKENNEAKLTMDFTAEEFEEEVNKVYRKNRNQFQINGFRKGKAPRSIIEKHYGEGIFFEDAINNMFGDHYPGAIEELELEVIDRPQVDFSEIGKGKPVTMTIDVKLFPVVEVKDYKGIEVEQLKSDASDEDVEKELEKLQKRNARMVVVDRPAKDGDTVLLDYSGFVGDEQFAGGTAERQELKLGSGTFISGFEEQLIGAVTGEDKDVNVTFPEEYGEKSLAGKDAVFHCKIHEIKEEQVPELDDEFAKDVSEFDTLEELKAKTKEDLEKAREEQYRNMAKDAVVNQVWENNHIEVPASMVEDEITQMAQELDQQLRYQGLSLEQYCQFTGKDMAGFREDVREDAEKRAGTRIVLRSIGEAENLEVSDDDVNEEMKLVAEQYGMDQDKVQEALADSMDYFRKDLMVKKVIDMLYDEANVTMVDAPEPEVTEENKDASETADDAAAEEEK